MEQSISYVTPEQFIELIDYLIIERGELLFQTDGRTQLYSGPHGIVAYSMKELCGKGNWEGNHPKAFKQAAWCTTKVIDHVEIGQMMGAVDTDDEGKPLSIYAYYNYVSAKHPEVTYGDDDWAFECADKVMRHASKKFSEAIHGEVFTAVCGAGLDKIFYDVELPILIKNEKVTAINGLPMEAVREIYSIEPYEAFRLICKAELNVVKQNAQKSGEDEDWADYSDRQDFFEREQKKRQKDFGLPNEAVSSQINEILETHKLSTLCLDVSNDNHPARPSGVVPKLQRKAAP